MNHKSSLPILLAFLSATASTGLAEQSVQEIKIGEKRQEITLGKRKKIKIPATAHQAPENLTLSNKFNAPPNCVVQDNGDIVVHGKKVGEVKRVNGHGPINGIAQAMACMGLELKNK